MSELTKGSALPRSLSESEQVYLAPVFSDQPNRITVAIRRKADVLYLNDHAAEDVRNWSENLPHHKENLTKQLLALSNILAHNLTTAKQMPTIMGIVNVTPDSFSDGGEFNEPSRAIEHARRLAEEGADILDFGGESTRPGADFVDPTAEIERIAPVISSCTGLVPFLSADTRKASVMEAAVKAGANMINDVTALEYDADSLSVVAKSGAYVCLMHSSADPKVMQDNPTYDHVLFDVIDYLKSRVSYCMQAGVEPHKIIIDPGIGFGKTVEHNLILLKGLRFFHALGCQVLLGASRKSFIGKIDEKAPPEADQRIGGSLSAVFAGLAAKVQIFRVHDVAQTRQAIAIWQAIDNTPLAKM